MNFQVRAIDSKLFAHYFEMSDSELTKIQATRIKVDEKPGYPCRISLQEANIGEIIIALPYMHHNVNSPYKASGPIFIRMNVKTTKLEVNEIPEILQKRLLSIRAYNSQNMMIDATLSQGKNLKTNIKKLFQNSITQYIHIHNANPGCFNCYVERV